MGECYWGLEKLIDWNLGEWSENCKQCWTPPDRGCDPGLNINPTQWLKQWSVLSSTQVQQTVLWSLSDDLSRKGSWKVPRCSIFKLWSAPGFLSHFWIEFGALWNMDWNNNLPFLQVKLSALVICFEPVYSLNNFFPMVFRQCLKKPCDGWDIFLVFSVAVAA